jgi:3-hydroxymyristoyl/3-hydroxydecanoyl-(acyl carrier protein) dehydratase
MKLPTVIAADTTKDTEIILGLELLPQSEVFCGHFPDKPILPGVVQIDWAVRFASLYLGIDNISARDFQVKFRNIIRPNVPLSLAIQFNAIKNQISFTYKSGDDLMSSGQLKLGNKA